MLVLLLLLLFPLPRALKELILAKHPERKFHTASDCEVRAGVTGDTGCLMECHCILGDIVCSLRAVN